MLQQTRQIWIDPLQTQTGRKQPTDREETANQLNQSETWLWIEIDSVIDGKIENTKYAGCTFNSNFTP